MEYKAAWLNGLGDQLEAFFRTVDFEVFRPDLRQALAYCSKASNHEPEAAINGFFDPSRLPHEIFWMLNNGSQISDLF